ncbi:MAG TPA: hypothetical protein VGQ09_06940 [Chitinophagaceae bacterium]|jgi:hypothetical protein|nr:hypothetical protein [Chitinophagaceae bacterium]
MKKFIIAFAAALTLISTTAFADSKEKINPALTTFEKEFKGATNVKWQEGKEAIKAAFTLNDFRVEAYFSYSGELIGTARNVLFSQLPLTVIKEINNRYGSAPVYDITEYNTEDETFYHMTVELPSKRLNIKATTAGNITVEKRIRK